MKNAEEKIGNLYRQWEGVPAEKIIYLPVSGSYRRYFRLESHGKSVIGVYNEDRKENDAFFSFTKGFHGHSLPVPELLAADPDGETYLLTDLGDQTLFSYLSGIRKDDKDFPEDAIRIYRKVIDFLPLFQVVAGKELDYSKCYPRESFDRQSMMWDLNYFKYYFLKLAKVAYDEQKLEDDFNVLVEYLLSAGAGHFMYRDFQSRNIMLVNGEPFFIDYQGGRKGPLQYDIASLLYDAKASIPEDVRDLLLDHYLTVLQRYLPVDRQLFLQYYYGFVLIRILQALGAYGFRGYYENKPHFLKSIPFAVANLEYLLENKSLPVQLPMLLEVLKGIVQNPAFRHYTAPENQLTVTVSSFAYKAGIPADESGNGGGFVFDCRALPNPGRFEEYRIYNGKDAQIIDFLGKEPSVDEFLNHACSLADQSVIRYIERGFTSLVISFGCTGGQHRSVYCAEAMAQHIRTKFPMKVNINHTELDKKND
ncbi:MAG: phosphotransferase [Bacteroidetes bacterium]|nr:phosphotransferase [Bacteroidota bacterium]